MASPQEKIYALIEYESPYVQPLIRSALKAHIPDDLLVYIQTLSDLPSSHSKLLQWRQYESIDFSHLTQNPASSVANSYVIRKALIRKHFLSRTVQHWLSKHPESVLGKHIKGSVDFEVDYAEFLDEALVEAFELRESWARNERLEGGGGERRDWWIVKPGMSERGQGIRLFSSEDELRTIFEEWDAPSSDEEDEQAKDEDEDDRSLPSSDVPGNKPQLSNTNILTSQLRHFVAQPYIHPPLLLSPPLPCAGHKFHVRAYVLAVGALKVYLYKPMLALFAAQPYQAPSSAEEANSEHLGAHLTNTCLQSDGRREGSVKAFWSLPEQFPRHEASSCTPARPSGTRRDSMTAIPSDWHESVFAQICSVTGEVFEAAARSMSVHFQPLPNAFEIFGLDFLVDAEGCAWLLEVNAFPDFAQTGGELKGLMEGLFEEVVRVGIRPLLGLEMDEGDELKGSMLEVLNIHLGRR